MKNEMNERAMLEVVGGGSISLAPPIIGGSLKVFPFPWLPHYAGPPVLHPPIVIGDPVPVPTSEN